MELEVRKGQRTREEIIHAAAPIFNQQGFFGTSISDVMRRTGLEKGGIYNHFDSKEALALATFDYRFEVASQVLMEHVRGTQSPLERLRRIVNFWRGYYANPPVAGGCVLLNTAVESDDAHPALRERARQGMDLWQRLIRNTVRRGVARGEMHPETDPDGVATLVIATLEGSLMLSKLYDDGAYMDRAVDYLEAYIDDRIQA